MTLQQCALANCGFRYVGDEYWEDAGGHRCMPMVSQVADDTGTLISCGRKVFVCTVNGSAVCWCDRGIADRGMAEEILVACALADDYNRMAKEVSLHDADPS